MIRQSVVFAFAALLLGCTGQQQPKSAAWQSFSGDKDIERRVDSVLKLMTLEEKIGQMAQFSANWSVTGPVMPDDFQPYMEKGLVGSIFNAVTVDGIRRMQEIAVEKTRLGIPILFGYDVVHGYKTIFPMPLAEACSWNLDLMKRTAQIAADEAASDGLHWTFAPMVDISRDPRWGRVMEGAGEDPYLGSEIAKARIIGFQGGEDWHSLRELNTVLACAKHFAAYGAAESGRDYTTAELSEHTLRNVYLPPYQASVDAGAATFMASFNDVNGVPATANRWLMTEILRQEWGFKGFVVTDYTGINELVPHGVAEDEAHAAELAANAGIDMDMTGSVFIKHLKQLVENGKVSETTIDNAVRRILEAKFMLGLFDDPYRYLDENRSKATIQKPEFMQTARKAVAESVVLLKNDNQLLPIRKNSGKKVALIGPMIKDSVNLNGEWQGRGDRNQSVSLYKGLAEVYAGSNVTFSYAEGSTLTTATDQSIRQAVQTAQKADMVLVALGEDFNWSGEAASLTDIRLKKAQRELLQALKKTGKPIALLVMSGRPLDLSWEDENLDAILQVWFPGTMGGYGVADVLAGDYNPSGRLVMSFPRSVGQVPVYYNQKSTGRPVDLNNPDIDYRSNYEDSSITPLYPFGYGLSYTQFAISDVALDKAVFSKDETLTVTAKVKNGGTADGELVAQLYIRDLVGSVTRPLKELKGFQKVALKAGESKEIKFRLSAGDLAFYGIDMKKKTEPGKFKLWVAQHSADNANEADFEYQ
ncbi:MAG: beta-glucosidase BglX [Capnocytophaga sp.]|nr:beta-glucosidase BglX [Capnocytophaga sp.]